MLSKLRNTNYDSKTYREYQFNAHVCIHKLVCMCRCCRHLKFPPASAHSTDVKENTAGKQGDVVRPEAMSLPLPYFSPWTGEHTILSSICQETSTYPFFSPLIKLRLFKHFCTSSPSWIYWCEKWGQEGCWKPSLFALSYKIIVCISLQVLVYIIIYKCNKSSPRPLLWVYFHINTCKHAH